MENMIVGTLKIKVYIPSSHSLKDKRKVVKSLKDKIHNKFNVSVAEVDLQDYHQTAYLGIAQVSNESTFLTSALAKVVEFVKKNREIEVVHCDIETF